MAQYYDKSTLELIMDFIGEFNIKDERSFKKQDIINWFNKKYPKIKNVTVQCHLIKLSVNAPSRKHYSAHEDGRHDILYQVNGNTFKLYDKAKDIISNTGEKQPPVFDDEYGSQEFAYEKDLQNYLIKNLSVIESGLRLFEDDGISGVEYPVEGRFIDILAVDKKNNFVVIELKVSKGYDRVVGQILRYKNWIKRNLAENGQNVRGMIICKEITDDLNLACDGLDDIELFEYELSIKLHKKEISK
ncbi:MAG: endonuclease NucS [Treponema sp.]|nr:endonuclease NucS [Treponema sp.]